MPIIIIITRAQFSVTLEPAGWLIASELKTN
jgi:hypothetical protein